MRVFIAVLVLIFSFQSWTKADDIRDFEIEGMSIGDSLLDYFSEEEINSQNKHEYPSSKKFLWLSFHYKKNFKIYDVVQFHIKSNDNKYIIYSVAGTNRYDKNIEGCYKEMDEVVAEISQLFKDLKKNDPGIQIHGCDKSGKSKFKSVYFYFKSGDVIAVACTDWSEKIEKEKKEWWDHLRVSLDSKEFTVWLRNEAYK